MAKAKPFVKWAGGKNRLIDQLEMLLPQDFDDRKNVTYIEPFVGGGAMLFHMLQTHNNIRHAVINDINPDLTTCYKIIKNEPHKLVHSLAKIQEDYYKLKDEEAKKQYYMDIRERFNEKPSDPIEKTTFFIFLNRTCFNGLYRVNKSGKFNVPCGRYTRPLICDAETILADSKILQNVDILTGDFGQTASYVNDNSFFYFDPPYRPLSSTSYFNDYTKETFDDHEQERLKRFCDFLKNENAHFMLSNSDCSGNNANDRFFDNLFSRYDIKRVLAPRCINSNGARRGNITEILVRNYTSEKKYSHISKNDKQLKLAL